jgi:hypothetical protein
MTRRAPADLLASRPVSCSWGSPSRCVRRGRRMRSSLQRRASEGSGHWMTRSRCRGSRPRAGRQAEDHGIGAVDLLGACCSTLSGLCTPGPPSTSPAHASAVHAGRLTCAWRRGRSGCCGGNGGRFGVSSARDAADRRSAPFAHAAGWGCGDDGQPSESADREARPRVAPPE